MMGKVQFTPDYVQTMSKRPDAYCLGIVSPFIKYASGPYLWNDQGRKLVDWVCGMGAVTLGHDYIKLYDSPRNIFTTGDHLPREEFTKLLRKERWIQYTGGQCYPLPSLLENQVAAKLCEMIPIAGQVRFVKTGSEATEGAIRIARMATGREKIIVCGSYHSWHSWFAASKSHHPGVPERMCSLVCDVGYNRLDTLELSLANKWGEQLPDQDGGVAAVILEPTLNDPPDEGYLQGVVDLAHKYGALVIFDEMVCGFRWAKAGGMEYFDVLPDLAVFGKGMANGFPLACIVGPDETDGTCVVCQWHIRRGTIIVASM